MRKAAMFTVVLWFAASLAQAGDSDGKLTFKEAGFSIAPLKEPALFLIMSLPASDGFAPNVNVNIQSYTEGIDAYMSLSKQQFKDAGIKVLSESKTNKSAVTFEYSGLLSGKPLHWYARAVQKGETIYLITATATEAQWAKVAAKLKACVDSFETVNH